MKKRNYLLSLVLACVMCLGVAGVAVASEANDEIDYIFEIEKIKQEEVEYQLQTYKDFAFLDKVVFLEKIGKNISNPLEIDNYAAIEEKIRESLDDSYIYYITSDGKIYNGNGYIKDMTLINQPVAKETGNVALASTYINGQNTGAFIRQTSVSGYMGISSSFKTPVNSVNSTNYVTTPDDITSGYIYNLLILEDDSFKGGYFTMEGGLKHSHKYTNYSAYIKVGAGDMLMQEFGSEGETDSNGNLVYPPRFAADASITHNLRYEPANKKIKYYVTGKNINGESQSLLFAYEQTFTATQLNNMHSGRVTGIGREAYNGTDNLGSIIVSYSNTKLCKSTTGTTYSMVDMKTSLLDTMLNGSKIMGTADFPVGRCTKAPLSGTIVTQKHTINF